MHPVHPPHPVHPAHAGAPSAPGVPVPSGERMLDFGDLLVLPGLVDTHVHINEPGRTDWEGFETATRAAAAGGVTTLVDMPLNSVPATTTSRRVSMLSDRPPPANAMWTSLSGEVSSPATPPISSRWRKPASAASSAFSARRALRSSRMWTKRTFARRCPWSPRLGLPLLVHAERPAALREPKGDPRRYRTWLESRPAAAETGAIGLVVQLAREYGTRVHIVHLATADALPLLRDARADGVAVTVETCPHYLTFAAEDIADGDTRFKCAPPIRQSAERERLWEALIAGDIDLIATDHSPAPPAMKHIDAGDFVAAWGGIASLQLGLLRCLDGRSGVGTCPRLGWHAGWPRRRRAWQASVRGKERSSPGADADLIDLGPGR